MKKVILKGMIVGIIFLVSIYVIIEFMNKGNAEMTTEMESASYPLIYVQMENKLINCLRGYASSPETPAMETSYLRESITPLEEGRKLNFLVEKYGNEIAGISFEVRSIDGSRLIESTQLTEYQEKQDTIEGTITVKDLIEQDKEYTLVILLEIAGENTPHYYTRIISPVDYHAAEKINYVYDFHEKTFDKEAARELTKYLEANAEGDNTTFSKVTIHSSFQQVTWGSLEVRRESEPVLYIKELAKQTGSFMLKYYVSLQAGEKKQLFAVEEFYRIRYTADRIYLLDFERTMDQVFAGEAADFVNSKIQLGITNPNVPLVESDGGNVFAFVTGNALYSYNIADNKLARLFSFYDENNWDERTTYNNHKIRILNVDEAGNVIYLVYGYMNRGRHEGEVGISVYAYNGMVNTVEEMLYIPYNKSSKLLQAEIDQMTYINKNGTLFLMMNNELYSINPEFRTYEVIVSRLREGSYYISGSNQMLAWQSGGDIYRENRLIFMNLNSGEKIEISTAAGEYIKPLGFMGEDLIYGVAKQADIVKDSMGNVLFPMYCVRIQNEIDGVVKEYRQENIFVTGCTIVNNQIILSQVQKTADGFYEQISNNEIMNAEVSAKSSNVIEVIATEKYQKLVQIAVKQDINEAAVKVLTPKEVLFEGGRGIQIQTAEAEMKRYYVYAKNGIEGVFMDEGNAVNLAYKISGVVINNSGDYVWLKGNRSIKNQIMAIQGNIVTEEKDSLAICLDTMLDYEGVVRNTEYMLNRGDSVFMILQENMDNVEVLDLGGCSLDAVLYYVNRDIPVLATLEDGSAVLIIGFNEMNIVVMDPQTGAVTKKGMNDSIAWFEENGNKFVTYVRSNQ